MPNSIAQILELNLASDYRYTRDGSKNKYAKLQGKMKKKALSYNDTLVAIVSRF